MSDLVYIVDDDARFRTAVARLLKLRGYEVAEFGSAGEFLECVVAGARPGCVLLDVMMPGLSGPELQGELSRIGASLPIVFLTGKADVPTAVRAIKAGAEDVLTKPVSEKLLAECLERAFASFEADRRKHEWSDRAKARLDSLTPREREVFDYVARGVLNKESAHRLGITERTIKAHRHRVFEKLGVRTVAELVSIAERLGLLP